MVACLAAMMAMSSALLAADRRAAPTKSSPAKSNAKGAKPKPNAAAAAKKEKPVEAIADQTRPSLVIISSFGRDGNEDGLGSGFVISPDGLVATSLHVIGEARPISVRLANGKRFEVTEIHAWDRKLDLAVIRIAATNLAALELGDSDQMKQGSAVVAMGNPLGLESSIVQGVLSARREVAGIEMLQLAIPIEPGNSGGPLVDLEGRVHGIMTMKSALSANLGFAVPINTLKPLLEKPNPVPMSRWLVLRALPVSDWQPLMGARWTQQGGRIVVKGKGRGFGGRALCLSKKKTPARPYEIAVTVKLDDEAGAAGLAFESDGDQKHYGFYPSAGQMRLTRFDGPTVLNWTILEQVQTPHYRPGDWNTLKVRLEADRILCFVNGHLVIESTDQELRGGQAGLAKFRDTEALFKGFQIGANIAANGPPQLPDELERKLEEMFASQSDEPDPALLEALKAHPDAARWALQDRAVKLERESALLRRAALRIHRQRIQAELLRVMEAPEEKVDLIEAALLVAQLDDPDLDAGFYRNQIDQLVAELESKISKDADEAERLKALQEFFFREQGFHGSRTDYYNRANSYLNQVLDDREGLPITLAILFMELAQRVGLQVAGIPLPGHFVVQHAGKNGSQEMIDVFDGGKPLTRDEAGALVLSITGSPLEEAHLKPATKRQIIVRMLRNLISIAQETEPASEMLRYLELTVALQPDSPRERFTRAVLRLRNGDVPGAKQDLKWLLDNSPSGLDLDQVAEMYRSL
jgi:serine protease Do